MLSLPKKTLQAVGSGRRLRLDRLSRWTVLIFAGRSNQAVPEQIIRTVRQPLPDPADILIVNIADLRTIPALFRPIAERAVEESYRQAARKVPVGQNPADYVIIVPDWTGELTDHFGMRDVERTAGVVLLNPVGEMVASFQKHKPAMHLLHVLRDEIV